MSKEINFSSYIYNHENGPIVYVDGYCDFNSARKLQNALSIAEKTVGNQVYVDLSRASYITSIGISFLISHYKKLKSKGRSLCLLNPSAAMMEMLEMTSLDKLLPIEYTSAA